MPEYLVRIVLTRPSGMDDDSWTALLAEEGKVGRGYREQGTIRRIWRVPGTTANVGVWSAPDASRLHELLAGLPAFAHITIQVEALAEHYLEASP